MTTLHIPEKEFRVAPPVLRSRGRARRLRANEPAVRAMIDFFRDPVHTLEEQCELDAALDEMFRRGVRACLVTRGGSVTGLVSAEDIRRAAGNGARRVQEVMTDAEEMPSVDWQTLRDATVRDLMEIFRGANVDHLVVLETESTRRQTVRGLVHRSRVEQRLFPQEALL